MSRKKKPDSEKPKKSQRHHVGKGVSVSAKSSKPKGGAGAKPQRRKQVTGRICDACGGTVDPGAESRHRFTDPKTGTISHPCIPQRWREVAVATEPVASVVVTEKVEEPGPTITAPSSTVAVCEHCKKLVPPGTEGNHFRMKQRVNARPGVMDKKWYCHPPLPPKPVAPPPKPVAPPPKPKVSVGGHLSFSPPERSYWTSSREWTCANGHGGSYASETHCYRGCGSTRPSETLRP